MAPAPHRDNLPLLALACVVVGLTVLVGRIAVSSHHVFIDEFGAISYGRSIADDPSPRVPGGRPTTLALRGTAGRLPDGSWLGPGLVYVSVAECR
jgi:hypothetical protein